MFFPKLRRLNVPQPPQPVYISPYKAKKLWPPDFSKLSHKHQFRLEKRYKRRTKLKWARPRWNKGVKVVQFTAITFSIFYALFFMDREKENRLVDPLRRWADDKLGSIWSSPAKPAGSSSRSSLKEEQ
ncbi:hypothetical protein L228DRAFT_30331 [Xylona heveae TC161]|uniref:Uncharacterized protein n=1 Tax=Xylona heveae (strain CBS 132557 / TC161) TaxID=1328760 RepID=A0A165A201_XYLHT|nr:hypothetical protein L228DRAFT_30331 [Xylona heveae TC161]KZF19841.1 hypothetical protein L228DRAFT_30331 [Xylona heveae TC161]